jgi:hypothetical protein
MRHAVSMSVGNHYIQIKQFTEYAYFHISILKCGLFDHASAVTNVLLVWIQGISIEEKMIQIKSFI